jgi:hypothetical protein
MSRALAVLVPIAISASVGLATTPDTRRLVELKDEAARLLKRAAEAGSAADRDLPRLMREAAQRLEALAGESAFPPALLEELKGTAAALRAEAERLFLPFQGSYSQPKVAEPAYGGHASAMGPPPVRAISKGGPSPVQFEVVPGLSDRTYCGGPTKDHLLESGGNGIALFDFDNDGRLDIYAVSAYQLDERRQRIPHRNALYRNLGGWTFKNVAREAGVDVAAWGTGVCAGDIDDDGLLDLYVTTFGVNLLFKNKGDGTFADIAESAGVRAGGWSTGCTFFDGNGDGRLDLYVARYATVTWDEVAAAQRTMVWRGGPKVMVGPVGFRGGADVYYENRGGGTFAEVTDARGLTDAAGAYGFGVVATDYDNDGWTDLYVANDSNPNFLYRNRGQGAFESTGLLSGVALGADGRAQAGMGVDAGDYDNDGAMDLVVTNFAHDSNTLYRNLGRGLFEDVTAATGLAAPTFERMGWGAAFLDADLDGDLDLFFANGHIYPQVDEFPALKESFRQKNQLFLNEEGAFRDVSETAGGGLRLQKSSRGLAMGDLDNDGDLDLVVSNMDDVPTLLENRQRTGHHWPAFQLKKDGTNRLAIGARVTVEAAGRRQVREVRSGGSYLSQSDLRAHFGLASHAGAVDVEVRLGRDRWRWKGLPIDRYTELDLREEDRLQGPR